MLSTPRLLRDQDARLLAAIVAYNASVAATSAELTLLPFTAELNMNKHDSDKSTNFSKVRRLLLRVRAGLDDDGGGCTAVVDALLAGHDLVAQIGIVHAADAMGQ